MKKSYGTLLIALIIAISFGVLGYFIVKDNSGKKISVNPVRKEGPLLDQPVDKGFNKKPGQITIEKPVIYFYPENEHTRAVIKLHYDGELSCVYPAFSEGTSWIVTAMKDGTLLVDGKHVNYLFWEGEPYTFVPDFTYSYCVKGTDTEDFLWEQLHKRGLKDTECADFITYWLPRMQDNKYNIIAFQEENYTESAKLTVYPHGESCEQIRVFMAFKASDKEMPITNLPDITTPERKGNCLIEWGGVEVIAD